MNESTPFNLDDYRVPPAAHLPADLDPETRALAEANEQRTLVIAGLRNLAQMLADHPELPVPYSVTVQAGPSERRIKDWDTRRQYVVNAAQVLGQPLGVDTETTATVAVVLHDHNPWVRYAVHAARPAEPEPQVGQWRPASNGAGKMRWFLIRETPGQQAEYNNGANGRLVRYGSYEAAQREADRLNRRQDSEGGAR